MKRIISLLCISTLILDGCGSNNLSSNSSSSATAASEQVNTSAESTVTNNIQVSDVDRLMGLKYWEDFPNNYSDLSNLYAYKTDQIQSVVVGTWDARDDDETTYEIEFTADGTVSIVGTEKTNKSINFRNGKWEASVNQIIITDLKDYYDGYWYLCALQDDDHVLLFRIYSLEKRPSATAFLMERRK